jgi:glycosyltransferase involved in cell wall biosynthesis/ubiquinone/menaquinone biosynthesis C-methylase UbiE
MSDWSAESNLPASLDNGAARHYENLHRLYYAGQFVKGQKVLDIGCGEGYSSYFLSLLAEHVVGFDINEQAIGQARSRYSRSNLEFVHSLTIDIPIKEDHCIDVIVCFDTMDHFVERDALMLEIQRLLKSDGILILSTAEKATLNRVLISNPPQELAFNAFENLLGRYFKYIHFSGQKVYSGSNIWPLTADEAQGYSEFRIEKSHLEFQPVSAEKKKAVNLIAIASNTVIDTRLGNANSWLIDLSNIIGREYQQQIKALNRALETREKEINAKDAEIRRLQGWLWRFERWTLSRMKKTFNLIFPKGGLRRLPFDLSSLALKTIRKEGWRVFFRKGFSKLNTLLLMAVNLPVRVFRYYQKNGLRKTISSIKKRLMVSAPYSPPAYSQYHTRVHRKNGVLNKIAFLPGDLVSDQYSASSRYRVFNLIEGLNRRGIESRTFSRLDFANMDDITSSDLVVIFRSQFNDVSGIISTLKKKRVPLVFDIDDLVFEPEVIPYIYAQNLMPPEQNVENALSYQNTLLSCDFCTTTTAYLAEKIQDLGKPSFIVKNTLNQAQMDLASRLNLKAKKNQQLKIAYMCGTKTHDKDFREAADALGDVLAQFPGVELHLVGELQLPDKLSQYNSRIIRRPFLPYLEMLEYLAQMDINIAPLELNNPFTAGKSELKIFEAGLVKVPTIASRTESYSRCITEGINGFLAGPKEEWLAKLKLLVESPELRERVGTAANRDFVKAFYVDNVIDDVIRSYEQMIKDYRANLKIDLDHLDIAWIIAEPTIGSGGFRNIFRAIKKLSEFGHQLTIYCTGPHDQKTLQLFINDHFYQLDNVTIKQYNGDMGYHDVGLATLWNTVYVLMQHKNKIKYPFYFVQDYEPLFYPMGSENILAENTYRMGLTHITSGPWPTIRLRNKFQAEADYFRFPVDKGIYNTALARTNRKKNLIFFAKPEMPRRCYEIGIAALTIVKGTMPDLEITLFGSSHVSRDSVPFDCTPVGILDLKGLVTLYRNADLGIVFSTTNPSLVPYEMMACGLAVADIGLEDAVTNYENRDNVLLLDPLPEIMAQQIVDFLNDDELVKKTAANGCQFVRSFPDEEGAVKKIEELIKRKITQGHL